MIVTSFYLNNLFFETMKMNFVAVIQYKKKIETKTKISLIIYFDNEHFSQISFFILR